MASTWPLRQRSRRVGRAHHRHPSSARRARGTKALHPKRPSREVDPGPRWMNHALDLHSDAHPWAILPSLRGGRRVTDSLRPLISAWDCLAQAWGEKNGCATRRASHLRRATTTRRLLEADGLRRKPWGTECDPMITPDGLRWSRRGMNLPTRLVRIALWTIGPEPMAL